MDWASIAGIILGVAGVLIGQGMEGGKLSSLLQPAAFAIVVVGTLGAVLLQTRAQTFSRGMQMLRWIIAPPHDTRAALARDIAAWNNAAKRDGQKACA
jgi:chemotaxis protein MotA